jgi:hypothetical protein
MIVSVATGIVGRCECLLVAPATSQVHVDRTVHLRAELPPQEQESSTVHSRRGVPCRRERDMSRINVACNLTVRPGRGRLGAIGAPWLIIFR